MQVDSSTDRNVWYRREKFTLRIPGLTISSGTISTVLYLTIPRRFRDKTRKSRVAGGLSQKSRVSIVTTGGCVFLSSQLKITRGNSGYRKPGFYK